MLARSSALPATLAFAEASALYPWDMTEWQAAVYLLTGCELVWTCDRRRGAGGPLDRPGDPRARGAAGERGAASEDAVMAWAAHFWDVGQRRPAKFPYVFEQFYFHRWITACHLRQKMAPALTVTQEPR